MKEETKVLLALFVGTHFYFKRLQQKNAMKTKASQANLQKERALWDASFSRAHFPLCRNDPGSQINSTFAASDGAAT